MTADQMWNAYCLESRIKADTPHEAWAFGSGGPDSDELASLVLQGIKTATASCHEMYGADDEPVPKVGDLSVILDSEDNAVCIIQDTYVGIVPYLEVSEEHAFLEGEGDRSLMYWRQVHEKFFKEECSEASVQWQTSFHVVCERFSVVYPRTRN